MRYLYSFLFFLLSFNIVHAQNYSWIIPNTPYLKLYVIEDGFYRINKIDFTQAGINTSNIDPRTVKVFYKGTEIPIYFEGEQSGVFADTDYIDFYGVRNYGGLTNTYHDINGINIVHYTTDEYYNLYSDTSVYWIGWGGNNGLRYSLSSFSTNIPYPQNFSYDRVHIEKDSIYSLGETINANTDFRYFNTEKVSGEGWYWRNFTPSQGYSVNNNFTTLNVPQSPQSCSFRVFAYPNSTDTSVNEHRLVLSINSNIITTLTRTHYNRFDTTVAFSSSLLSPSGNNSVSVTYAPSFGNPNITPSLYFDLIEIKYPKIFKFQNNQCSIALTGTDTTSSLFKAAGFNSGQPVYIYDINNHIRTVSFSTAAPDTLLFTAKNNSSLQILNNYITKKPFRIIQRQVPNLASNTNGADYIIIYNRMFESQAEELRQHRQAHDKFRAFKAAVDDITDIFNYGMEDPVSIRRFMDLVYTTWQTPRVGYVCLLGRGSLDPKNNLLTSSYYTNFVPVYGNPPSDGYFVNNNFGGFTYFKKIAVGRLPAYTSGEAQDMVNKIINYDNLYPDQWWKSFIMITGGPDRIQQVQYQQQSDQFVNTYISPPPVSGDANKIYRNDSAGYITFNYADSIRNEINSGGLIVNFIGHAASQDWELGLQDPFTLSNGPKIPLVLSMTCFTGKNAEPNFRSFGEKFMYYSGGGAIGFLGSTGWSFASSGNSFNNFVLKNFSIDSVRRIGDLVKYASQQLAPDSITFATRNTINSYNLMGDPATKLAFPAYPEFAIGQTDYKISNPYPLVGEHVSLVIYPKNFGLFAPNCLIRFQILKNGNEFRRIDTLVSNFAYLDTAQFNFSIDTIGNYSVKVTLDADDRYPLEIKSNNVLAFPLPLRNISYTPLKPINNSVIRSDSVEFSGLNPQVDPARNNIKVILQADTSKSFAHPLLNYTNNNISGVVTRFKYRIPFTDTNIVYYWRTNSIVNTDTTGWSGIEKFIYNPLTPMILLSKNLPNKTSGKTVFSGDSNITLYTKYPGQFENPDLNNLRFTNNGIELASFKGNLQVKSYGNNGSEASFFILNNYTLFIDGGNNPGLNMCKVSRLTGKLLEFKNFRLPSPQSSDTVLAFLNTFDTTQYILLGNASYTQCTPLSLAAKNKIKQFGSVFVDSVQSLGAFDTWAFIGYLGASSKNTSEQFHNYSPSGQWIPSFAALTPAFLNTSGSINFSIGPAHRWKNFSWNEILYPFSSIKYNVIGIRPAGDSVLLYSGLASSQFVSLDTVNSFIFPQMKLAANFAIDTVSGSKSPVFNSMNFKYTPPAEIIPDNYSFVKSDTVVQEGANVTFSVKTYNAGFVPANIVLYKWTANTPSGIRILKYDTVYTPLNPDSMKVSSVTFNTAGLRHRTKTKDTVSINFEAALLGNQNDYFPFNNFAFSSIIVTGDSTRPDIEVTYDSNKLLNGDLIPAKPLIIFSFYDAGKLNYTMADTSNIFIKLDNNRIRYSLNSQLNPDITFNPVNNGNLKVVVTYKPSLSEGDHVFQYIGSSQNGIRDTITNNATVSNAFSVRDLYNYPNPMRSETYFTFNLFSSEAPQSCKIKIYTVAGRLVKDLNFPARVGFNQVYWDGRDNDGESMANGVYLYKIILESQGKTETSIQKLAILR
jgi:hypothetical protein